MTERPAEQGFDLANPDPAALVESLRAFGYTPEAAVADLVDNSVTAKAKQLWIQFDWAGRDSRISIRDDGVGMTERDLVQAMTPGSRSPLEQRAADDLGRFGLGLKTASFSQCRRLTVVTKTRRGVHARRWLLDEVISSHEWRLRHGYDENSTDLVAQLEAQPHGTLIIWHDLDRVVGNSEIDDEAAHRRFLELARAIRSHLATTFHRYLAARSGMTFFVNDHEVPPWDPFLSRNPARQVLPAERLAFRGGHVTVRPYVLPHRSKLATEDFELAGGERGWNSLQGFYVYRNERLLVAGDWLGLGFQKEEHYKLARIQVDMTTDMDADWQIDVRKSVARVPGPLIPEFRRIAKATRTIAVEVYRHRGKVLTKRAQSGLIPMWQQRVRHGKVAYELNRTHPSVVEALENPSAKTVRGMIKLVEETIPVPLIAISNAERPEEQATPFADAHAKELVGLAVDVYGAFRRRGLSHAQARQRVMATDPFHLFPELVETLDAERTKDGE